jgi:HlyD family secretion protein
MKRTVIRVVVLVALAGAVYGAWRLFRQFGQDQQPVPTAVVRRGDVIIRSYTRGELRAVRSSMLVAPNLFGTVQITRLAQAGALAREKDLIVEFDDSEVRSRLEEKQLQLDQLNEQIKKAQAELEIRNSQDQVELLKARFGVRGAELEVQRNELLSEIDATKNKLNLEEARRRLKQLESDVQSRLAQSQAELAVLREKKNQATLELQREKQRLSQVKLLAPIAGLVAVRQSRPMGFFYRGMQLPDLREGDQVFPGTPVADVLDLSQLEVAAKVGEIDRANLREGQDATYRLDAIPDKTFHGKIKMLSGTASADVWSGDVAKKFDVVFSVDMKELLTGLGASPEQIRRAVEAAARSRAKAPPPGMAGGPREAFRKAMGGRSFQDLSPEERQKLRERFRGSAGRGGTGSPGGGAERSGAGSGSPGGAERGGAGSPGGTAAMAAPGAGGPQQGPPMLGGFGAGRMQQFSDEDLEKAELPAPPAAGSQMEALLRPGLLADVEIIVEKVPNAVHIPLQAVFEKDGRLIVYVKNGSRFDERPIKPSKRSESVVVVAEGLSPGEQVALSDPNKRDKQSKRPGAGKKSGVPSPAAGPGGNRS